MRLPLDALISAINKDPEFRIAARMWSSRILYQLGDDRFILIIQDGVVASVIEQPGLFEEWRTEIIADDEVWSQILADKPRPFYQDLFPAQLCHGLRMRGDLEGLFAYYPAIRRITDLMRYTHNSVNPTNVAS